MDIRIFGCLFFALMSIVLRATFSILICLYIYVFFKLDFKVSRKENIMKNTKIIGLGIYVMVENNPKYFYSKWVKVFGFGSKLIISNPVSC